MPAEAWMSFAPAAVGEWRLTHTPLESKRIIGSCKSPRTTSVAPGSTSSRSPRSPSTIVGRKACSARVACEIRSRKSSATVGAPECAAAVPGNARKPPRTINTRAGTRSAPPRARCCTLLLLDRTPLAGVHSARPGREPEGARRAAVQRERPGAPELARMRAPGGHHGLTLGPETLLREQCTNGPLAQPRQEGECGCARRHDDQDREPPSVRDGHEHEGVGGDAVLDRLLHEQEGQPRHGQPDCGLVEGTTRPQARQAEVTVEEPEEDESDDPGDRRQ